jgi:large subunit ribosomal protein L25
VQLEAEATHIPEAVEVSVEGAEAGTQILAAQLDLPSGSTLVTDGEALVVNVTAAQTAEALEAELEAAEAEAGIERDEAEAPAEGEGVAEGETAAQGEGEPASE